MQAWFNVYTNEMRVIDFLIIISMKVSKKYTLFVSTYTYTGLLALAWPHLWCIVIHSQQFFDSTLGLV